MKQNNKSNNNNNTMCKTLSFHPPIQIKLENWKNLLVTQHWTHVSFAFFTFFAFFTPSTIATTTPTLTRIIIATTTITARLIIPEYRQKASATKLNIPVKNTAKKERDRKSPLKRGKRSGKQNN